ncbi:hypothetical protein QUA88_16070, partial [Microcoleus sp. D3_18_C2]
INYALDLAKHFILSCLRLKLRCVYPVLPPDLFERFDGLSFWTDATYSRASAIVAKAKLT